MFVSTRNQPTRRSIKATLSIAGIPTALINEASDWNSYRKLLKVNNDALRYLLESLPEETHVEWIYQLFLCSEMEIENVVWAITRLIRSDDIFALDRAVDVLILTKKPCIENLSNKLLSSNRTDLLVKLLHNGLIDKELAIKSCKDSGNIQCARKLFFIGAVDLKFVTRLIIEKGTTKDALDFAAAVKNKELYEWTWSFVMKSDGKKYENAVFLAKSNPSYLKKAIHYIVKEKSGPGAIALYKERLIDIRSAENMIESSGCKDSAAILVREHGASTDLLSSMWNNDTNLFELKSA